MQVLKDEIRDSIYQSALKEFRKKGYEKTSMRAIAQNAGIAVGNMYRYFKNKEDLFCAVISPAYNKLVNFITMLEIPENTNREILNMYLKEQVSKFVKIYLENKNELMIIIDGSKGTKYEYAIQEIIKLVENIVYKMVIISNNEGDMILNDEVFPHILSTTVIEGVILILKNYEEKEKVNSMVEKFISIIFKDFHERI